MLAQQSPAACTAPAPPLPGHRAHPRALSRFYFLKDRSLADLVVVLQACKLRRGVFGGTAKQERAWLAVELYLEDPATPTGFPTATAYKHWRAADPERSERLPSYDFIANAFGGWDGVAAAFGAGPPRLDVLARRKTALGRYPTDAELRVAFDVWAEAIPEDEPLLRDDLLGFLTEVQRLLGAGRSVDPRLRDRVLPRSWDSYYRRFRTWEALLADRGMSHRSVTAVRAARKAAWVRERTSSPARPRRSWKDRPEYLIKALRWAAAPARLGRFVSYPGYDELRATSAEEFLLEVGFAMPSSCTVRRYLGSNNWIAAKLAAEVITVEEAGMGMHAQKRSDEALLEMVWCAILHEGLNLSRPGYRLWRGQYRTEARAAGLDDWCPTDDTLLDHFGGDERDWDNVIQHACDFAPSLRENQEALV